MIRCCVFDADGTLLDSMPMWRDITYEYAAQKGIDAPAGLHNTLIRLSLEQCAAYYQSLGAAYGMVLAVIILVLTLFQFWLDKRNSD